MGIESLMHAAVLTPANVNPDNKSLANAGNQVGSDAFSQQLKTEVKRLHSSDDKIPDDKKNLTKNNLRAEQSQADAKSKPIDDIKTASAETSSSDQSGQGTIKQESELHTQQTELSQDDGPLSHHLVLKDATEIMGSENSLQAEQTANNSQSNLLDATDLPQQPVVMTLTNDMILDSTVMAEQMEGLQEIAGNNGKVLPGNKKTAKDLNLDATLQALAEVMAKIPEPETTNVAGQFSLDTPVATSHDQLEQEAKSADTSAEPVDILNLLPAGFVAAQAEPIKAQGLSQSPQLKADTTKFNPESNAPNITQPPLSTESLPISEAGNQLDLNASQQNSLSLPEEGRFKDALNALLEGQNTANGNNASAEKNLAGMGSEMLPLVRGNNQAGNVQAPPMTNHVYSSEWSKELGAKILWMTSQTISQAELKLNPEHLGPISIQINMQQDQASINFTAHNANVKDMLEASLPKLREMLQSQQLNLADVNVSQQSLADQGQRQAQNPFFGQAGDGQKPHSHFDLNAELEQSAPINEMANQIEQSRTLVTNGLVSLYA